MTKISDDSEYPRIYRLPGSATTRHPLLPAVRGRLASLPTKIWEIRHVYGIWAAGDCPVYFANDEWEEALQSGKVKSHQRSCWDSELIRDESHLLELGFVCIHEGSQL